MDCTESSATEESSSEEEEEQEEVLEPIIVHKPPPPVDLSIYTNQIDELKKQIEEAVQATQSAQSAHGLEMEVLETQYATLQGHLDAKNESVRITRSEIANLDRTIKERNNANLKLETEIETTKRRMADELEQMENERRGEMQRLTEDFEARIAATNKTLEEVRLVAGECQSTIDRLTTESAEKQSVIDALEKKSRASDAVRRGLLNHIQDLKGNVCVICRVRPPMYAVALAGRGV